MRATFPPDLSGSRPNDAAPGRSRALTAGCVCFVLVTLWTLVAPVPFLSEDWTQMALLARVDTLFGALDPALEPLRPLQHAFLWTLAHCGVDPTSALPAAARAFAFSLHGVACLAVWGLARHAGIGGVGAIGALVATLLFVAFPNVKMLAWPAAIGSPGRTAFELVALLFLVRRLQTGSARDGWIGLAALAVSLGFHETALLLPAILLVWTACVGVDGLAQGVRRAWTALRDPFVLGACAIGALHLVHLLFFRPERVHGAKDPAALPANFVKAALSLAPEFVRDIGIEGFRGNRGTIGFVAAGLVLALVAFVAAVMLRRGGVARFAVLAIAIDLGLAVVGAGFVQRYACLASAFAALALAHWACTRPNRAARIAIAILGLAWLADSTRDALEVRRAGAAAEALAREVRALAGSGPLAIVGVPDMIGAEEDVPFFNWGGELFLRAHGVARPVELLRERAFRTNSDQTLVDAARVHELQVGGVDVVRWSQTRETLGLYGR